MGLKLTSLICLYTGVVVLKSKEQIIDEVVEEFAKLAAIPRQSGHEKAVSDFLAEEFAAIGCKVIQDETNNIIADLPPTAGMEDKPMIILQGHMDMVCVAADGVCYDPLNDPIKLLRNESFIFADGTSLGGDDGIAIAEALYLFKNLKKHGPLRVIITVDEERGMTGAERLDKKYLEDARFLINCDSEEDGVITVGCAGGVNIDLSKPCAYTQSLSENHFKLVIQGIKGGHSGVEIHKGRANAIKSMAFLLDSIREAGHGLQLISINGGEARNAIPVYAEAKICTSVSKQMLHILIEEFKESFIENYGDADNEVVLTAEPCDYSGKAISEEDSSSIIDLLLMLHTGVFGMSQVVPSLVETSANIGVISTDDGIVQLQYYPRSSNTAKLKEIGTMVKVISSAKGFAADIGEPSPGWKEKGHSVLADTLRQIYQLQNGMDMSIATIHAGLECGWFAIKNKDLDIVSIGVNTFDIHSPKERLELASIATQVNLIESAILQLQE